MCTHMSTHLHTADEGGREIAEMLRHNQTIRKLLLSSNLLGDTAVEAIADSLSVNSGLEMLLMGDNPFGDEGGRQLCDVLCNSNRSLKVLDIHGTRMSKAVEKEVCVCVCGGGGYVCMHVCERAYQKTVCEAEQHSVKRLDRGHSGDNINSTVVSFVERWSLSQRFHCYHIERYCINGLFYPHQIAHEIHRFSSLTKLGSSYGSKSSQAVAHVEVQAKKQARRRQEQNFQQQAAAGSQLTSQLSPSHLY